MGSILLVLAGIFRSKNGADSRSGKKGLSNEDRRTGKGYNPEVGWDRGNEACLKVC